MKGKVFLVGAGPGDPDLLTLKALRLLRTSDAVLYDDLVSPEILKLVSPVAQLYNVGKRCGAVKISQAEISFLMISLAESGLTVVRLKSGDPLIFGRGGEEIEALRYANIECEIVPGVTAALGAAAAARIPLTHRRISHTLFFLTGHITDDPGHTDWKNFVSSRATLAIYMPGPDYVELATRLMDAGLRGETPCAIVSAATTSDQEMELTTVRELARVRPIPAPSLLIVGEVVRLAQGSATWNQSAHAPSLQRMRPVLAEEQRLAAPKEIA
jgi:uroporphyrin-III C-methyltransferase